MKRLDASSGRVQEKIERSTFIWHITVAGVPVSLAFVVVLALVTVVLSVVAMLDSLDCRLAGPGVALMIASTVIVSAFGKTRAVAITIRNAIANWIAINGYAVGAKKVCSLGH